MREPVLILSDLHLGHHASRVEGASQFRPLLEGMGTVVLNGDTFQELALDLRPRSEVLFGELKGLCRELGVEMVMLSGNHDPGWPGKGWVEMAEGRIVVTHGDSVFWTGSPWSRERFEREERLEDLWSEHHEAECDTGERLKLAREIALELRPGRFRKGRSLLRRVVDALSPPRRAWEILKVWLFQVQAVSRFAERYFPEAEVLVIGHFHYSGVWVRDGRLIINTGTYVSPHHALWAEWCGGVLRCGKVEEDGDYRRGECLGVWRV